MARAEFEVDSIEGTRLLLHFQDRAGRTWVAGAVASDLRQTGGEPWNGDAHRIEDGQHMGMQLTEFNVVVDN